MTESPAGESKRRKGLSAKQQLILDVIEGHGGTFSLEGPLGKAFHTRSRVFSAAELAELDAEPG